MPVKTVASHLVAERLVAPPADPIRNTNWVGAITLLYRAGNTGTVYIGYPGTDNVGSNVSPANYDAYLDGSTFISTTNDLGSGNAFLPLDGIWILPSVDGEGVSYYTARFKS